MIYTNQMEKNVAKGTSYWDCFKGTDLRRTEIVCMVWIAQTLSGTVVGGLSSYFYVRAGINVQSAYRSAILRHRVAIPHRLTMKQPLVGPIGHQCSWNDDLMACPR